MRSILNYIWRNRLLPKQSLFTTDGKKINIKSYGREHEEGNLFVDAHISFGEESCCGCVLIHDNNDKHEEGFTNEQSDVILHVIPKSLCKGAEAFCGPCRVLVADVPQEAEQEYSNLVEHACNMTCRKCIASITEIEQHSYMSRLSVERIEEKSALLEETLAKCSGNWNDTLLKSIIRSFGFGIQGAAFEKYAETINVRAIEKHRDNPLQVEAIMFGQAGLLEESAIPHYYRDSVKSLHYYSELEREYKFLRNKFGLEAVDSRIWDSNHTPHVRIARVAKMFRENRIDISRLLECEGTAEFRKLLDNIPDGYWSNHTCIGGCETSGNGNMSRRHLDVVIINSIVPIIYMWGKKHRMDAACSKAEEIMHRMNPEENGIVRRWREAGCRIECAADSQAVIQLDKRYCRMHRCAECRFGYFRMRELMAAK